MGEHYAREKECGVGSDQIGPIQSALNTGLAKAYTVVSPGQCWTVTPSAVLLLFSKKGLNKIAKTHTYHGGIKTSQTGSLKSIGQHFANWRDIICFIPYFEQNEISKQNKVSRQASNNNNRNHSCSYSFHLENYFLVWKSQLGLENWYRFFSFSYFLTTYLSTFENQLVNGRQGC